MSSDRQGRRNSSSRHDASANGSEEGAAVTVVAVLLTHLAINSEQRRVQIFNASMLRRSMQPLITLLKEGSMSTKRWVTSISFLLAEKNDQRSEQIFNAGALQPLVAMLKDGEDDAKSRAAIALGNLSSESELRSTQIINAGTMQLLVMLLKEGTDESARFAATALANLALYSKDGSEQIVEAGALQPLVTVLKEGSEALKLVAAQALANLMHKSDELTVQIVSAGALQPFITLLKQGPTNDIRSLAALALANVAAHNEKWSVQITDSGALPLLVMLLKKGSKDARTNTARALKNLASNSDDLRASIVKAGAPVSLLVGLSVAAAAAAADAAGDELLAEEDTAKVRAVISPCRCSLRHSYETLNLCCLSDSGCRDQGKEECKETGPKGELTSSPW